MSRLASRATALMLLLAFVSALAGLQPHPPAWSPIALAHADDDDDDDDSDGGASGGAPGMAATPEVVPFEVIALDLSQAQVDALAGLGYTLVDRQRLATLQTTLFRFREPGLLQRFNLPQALQSAGLADRIHPNHRYRLASEVCSEGRCYAFEAIGWPVAAAAEACGRGLTIGMIDTAVDPTHPALRGARIETSAFLGDSPSYGHGTAVAALLVGRPDSAHPGLLPSARLFAADVFERDLIGQPRTDAHAIVRALEWLASKRVRVINMSFAGPDNPVLHEAVRRTVRRNVAIAAAGGNDGPAAGPAYPAAWEEAIAVTAVDASLRAYRRANRGSYLEIAAPGVGIWTAQPDGQGRFDNGTSFAAVFVTAALAERDPRARMSVATLRAQLARETRDLGDRGRDKVFGHGLLQSRPGCGGSGRR